MGQLISVAGDGRITQWSLERNDLLHQVRLPFPSILLHACARGTALPQLAAFVIHGCALWPLRATAPASAPLLQELVISRNPHFVRPNLSGLVQW